MFQGKGESQWYGCRLFAMFVSRFIEYQEEKFLK
jgi:hypothetical protein